MGSELKRIGRIIEDSEIKVFSVASLLSIKHELNYFALRVCVKQDLKKMKNLVFIVKNFPEIFPPECPLSRSLPRQLVSSIVFLCSSFRLQHSNPRVLENKAKQNKTKEQKFLAAFNF